MYLKMTSIIAVLFSVSQIVLADCSILQTSLIEQKRAQKTFLGAPISSATSIIVAIGQPLGCMKSYQNGAIYVRPGANEAFEVSGLNKIKYDKLHGVYGLMGYPLSDEMNTPGGRGRYNKFERGEIYYRNGDNESFEINGTIWDKWKKLGGITGALGFPMTDETSTPDQFGKYNHFENGSIYWRTCLGAYQVTGLIRNRWAELGWENSYLGYPLSDELNTADNNGRYNRFQRGIIVWHPTFGTHLIWGKAYHKWIQTGGVSGTYGYPKGELVCGLNSCMQSFSKSNLNVLFLEGIDLRSEISQRHIDIRNQGSRGTCSVQAMTFLLEYAYTQMCGESYGYNHLSVEYLNHETNKAGGVTCDGDIFSRIADGYQKYGIILDSHLPYDKNRIYNYSAMENYIQQNDLEAKGLDTKTKFSFQGKFIKSLDGTVGLTGEQMSSIRAYLDRQIPVAIGRGHSMVVVGYDLGNQYPGGGRFIFRNSYGTGVGINGYQYEDFQSVKNTTNDVYVYEIPGLRSYIPQPR